MQVQDIMTRNPTCCSEQSTLQEVAQMMAACDCGEIPVVDSQQHPVGVVTDRDICIRAVATGRDITQASAGEIMSTPVHTVKPQDDLEEVCRLMEQHLVRRLPVVDDNGVCCGIVAQADIAIRVSDEAAAEVVRDISQSASPASRPAH